MVGHVMFADPFDDRLRGVIARCGRESLRGEGVQLHDGGTLICMGEITFHPTPPQHAPSRGERGRNH